jgi:hypothetical protein
MIFITKNKEEKSKSLFLGLCPMKLVILFSLLTGVSFTLQAQNCTVNADISRSICENEEINFRGSSAGLFASPNDLKWTQTSGPSLLITDPSDPESSIVGYTGNNVYGFRLSVTCQDGVAAFQDIEFTILPITKADAGPDQTACPGSSSLNANSPGVNESGNWSILGDNAAGVTIDDPTSPTSTFSTATTSAGVSSLIWTIINTNGCSSPDTVNITNLGGETPVAVTPNVANVSNCYSTTTAYPLMATFGGIGLQGQIGTWSQISGPSNVTFSDVNSNTAIAGNLIEGTYKLKWTVTGNCANGFDTIRIIVPKPLQDISPALSPNIELCNTTTEVQLNGSPAARTNEIVRWRKVSGTGTILDTTTSNTTLTGLTLGATTSLTYSIIDTVTGCVSTVAPTVSYADTPSIQPISNLTLACDAVTVDVPYTSIGGPFSRSLISAPDGFTAETGQTVPSTYVEDISPLNIAGLLVGGTYVFNVRKEFTGTAIGCVDTETQFAVTTSVGPAGVNAGTDQLLICNTDSTFMAGNNPDVGVIGTWSQVSGPNQLVFEEPNNKNSKVKGLNGGLYELRWVLNGGLGCRPIEDEVFLNHDTLPPQSIDAGDPSTVCFGNTFYLEAGELKRGQTGEWSVTPSAGVTFDNINDPKTGVSGTLANTAYTFRWSVSNPCGTTVDSVVLTTNNTQAPIASDAGTDQCLASGTTSITLEANNPSPFTGAWSKLSGPSATITDTTDQNTTVTGLTDGTYEFVWKISNGLCEPNLDTVVITISGATTNANAGMDRDSCGSSMTLDADSVSTGTGTWEQFRGPGGWEVDDINSPTARFTSLISGTYIFKWVVTNDACPSTEDRVRFTIDNPPTFPTADSSQRFCDGTTTVDLLGNEIENGYAIWSTVGNPPVSPVITDATADTTTATGLVTGVYSFQRATYSVFGLCPSFRDTVTDIIINIPADLGPDKEICELESSVEIVGNQNSIGNWKQISGGSVDTSVTDSNRIIVSNFSPGTYEFEYEIPAINGCATTRDTILITVSDSVVAPAAGLDSSFCNATSFNLTSSTSAVNSATSTWSQVFGPTGGTITNPDSANTTVTGITAGLYVFHITTVNGACSSLDEVRRENFAPPTTALAGSDQNICPPSTTLEGNFVTSGVGKWTQIGNTPSTAIIEAEIDSNTEVSGLTSVGTYSFEWTTFTDSLCPISRDTVDIIIADLNPTVADAGADIQSCEDTSINLAGNSITTGTGLWKQVGTTPAVAVISTPSSPTTSITLSDAGTYVFEWESTNGSCTTADRVNVVLLDSVVQPQAGPDSSVCIEDNISLYASNTGSQYFAWSQLSGPSTASFIDSNSYTTGLFGLIDGTYEFVIKTTNGICPSKSDTVELTVDANCFINLSGRLYNDVDGLRDNPTPSVDGIQFDNPEGEQMYVSLITGGVVYATVPIANNGTYNFLNIENNLTYDIVIHRTPAGSLTPDLPLNWVHTGENQGLGANGDGTNNGLIQGVVASDSDEVEINFGIQERPESDTLTVSAVENPGGDSLYTITDSYFGGIDTSATTDTDIDSIRITTFPSNIDTIEINGVKYGAGDWPANGVIIPSDGDGVPQWTIRVDPVAGSNLTQIDYVTIDQAGYEDLTPGYVRIPFTLSISGKVHHDFSGLTDNTINDGDGIDDPDGTQLYANLVDSISGNVIATTPIAADGTYKIIGLEDSTSFEVIIDILPQTVGQPAAAGSLPQNWVFTGDTIGVNTGTDGTPNGRLFVRLELENQPNVNYGIQKRPESDTITFAAQPNPGGDNLVTVASGLFGGDDASAGEDPPIDSLRITTFPANVDTIEINGTKYGVGDWPANGVTIPTDADGNPDWAIRIDPINGQHVADISYVTIDSAGYEDLTPGYVRMPFWLKILGKVHHDFSGLTDNTINDGDGIDDPDGTQLYANLIDQAADTVIKTVAIAADGTYEFDNLTENTNYDVLIDTLDRAVGSSTVGAVGGLPENWVHTGDTIGANNGTDGVNDGRLSVALLEVDIPNVNYGIQKRPESDTITIAAQPNPGGDNLVTVASGLFGGDDASTGEDPPIDSLRITTFPANVDTIEINGTKYGVGDWPANGVTIPTDADGNPDWAIRIDPINGQHVADISYVTIDSAGYEDLTPGYVRMPFWLKILGKVHHDFSGLTDNTINDGDGIDDPDGTQLYANLIDQAADTVIKTVAIAADGTYEFDNLTENTNYDVLIDTLDRAVGSSTVGAVGGLPENWVHTGDTIGANNGTDGVNDGRLSVALLEVDIPNVNYGIQKRPESDTITIAAQPNPGGDNLVTVASGLFGGDDASTGEDPPIDSLRITTFPANVDTIEINGTKYGVGDWPANGVTIPTDADGNPDWVIRIDPINGQHVADISYVTIDSAGYEDLTPGYVRMPFWLKILGKVHHDFSGLTDNTINDGDGIDDPDGTQLYANLIDQAADTVIKTVAIAADGTYEFDNLTENTNYDVLIDTLDRAVGSSTVGAVGGLPENWVHTGDTIGANNGTDGVNDGRLSVALLEVDIPNVNYGIQKRPESDTITIATQHNPGGTTLVDVTSSLFGGDDASTGEDPPIDSLRITTFPTNITSIEINGTTYGSGFTTWPANGVTIPTDADGNPDWTVRIDPVDGSKTTQIDYVTIDSAGFEDLTPGYIRMPFRLKLLGKVHHDFSGLTDNTINDGDGIDDPDGTQLYANLIDQASNTVVGTVAIATDGTYEFDVLLENTNYDVLIDTLARVVGSSTAGAVGGLPENWVHTGDTIGVNNGTDGVNDGRLSVAMGLFDQPNVNFGIQKRPESDTITIASQPNPGGTTLVDVTSSLFGGDDASTGEDPPIDSLRITTFPSNITSIEINGTTYGSGFTTWPANGVTIPTDADGNPDWTVRIDPVDGSKTTQIDYVTIDSAGYEDLTPGYIRMPFRLRLEGNVYTDSDGLTDNTVDGTPTNTPDATQLYAILVDNSGDVVATTPIAADGTYVFDEVLENTVYKVILDDANQTVGQPATSSTLPGDWVNTGENEGSGAGSDGTVDGEIQVTMGVTDKDEVNFGIEQTPDSDNKSHTLNPAPSFEDFRDLKTSDGMSPLSGSDPEDGTYGQGDDFVVTDTSGMNGNRLFYDENGDGIYQSGEELVPGDTVLNYDSTKLSVEFLLNTSFTFRYGWIDSAGFLDPTPATYTVNWGTFLPVELIYFNVQKDNRVSLLTWATASELNNKHFVIEHMTPGEDWVEIGIQEGAGTTRSITKYSYTHHSPKPGMNYYRLKQVDFNGNYEYTETKFVIFESDLHISVYPNPARDVVHVEVDLEIEGLATVVLYDALGTELQTKNITGFGQKSISIQTGQYSRGTYYIKTILGTREYIRKVTLH